MEETEANLAAFMGALAAIDAAVRELVMALPPDSPIRTTLQAARERQLRAIREEGQSEIVLFACERAWLSMLAE